MTESLIPKHGGYRKLKSFQIAQLAYDLTVRFCENYIDPKSRTKDQMVQAARSGVQNIAEGSQASGTSKKMEMKLTNVARASLEELLLDYEDYLRQRSLPIWDRNDPRRVALIDLRPSEEKDVASWARRVHSGELSAQRVNGGPNRPNGQNDFNNHKAKSTVSTSSTQSIPSTQSTQFTPSTKSKSAPPPTYPEILANAAHALVTVACSLLDRQLQAQAKAFENEGGFTETLYKRRQERRRAQ
jgi:four helix bundle suffix protein